MVIIIQEVIRYLFYIICVYAFYLIALLIKKNWSKKERSTLLYIVTTMFLLIILGNITIFNIDMYNAILGSLEIHTVVYLLLMTGGLAVIYFLRDIIKNTK